MCCLEYVAPEQNCVLRQPPPIKVISWQQWGNHVRCLQTFCNQQNSDETVVHLFGSSPPYQQAERSHPNKGNQGNNSRENWSQNWKNTNRSLRSGWGTKKRPEWHHRFSAENRSKSQTINSKIEPGCDIWQINPKNGFRNNMPGPKSLIFLMS